jgi:hypothetical protein
MHMTRRRLTILIVSVALVAVAIPVGAITKGGSLDGDDHPYVGLAVFHDGTSGWRCSGALISPTVFVTAGHCTTGSIFAQVFFESDVDAGRPANGYPFGPGTAIVAQAAYSHPLYDDAAFYLYDVGVVILSEEVELDGGYAGLPEVGAVDQLGKGRKQAVVTAVGYGLQEIVLNPWFGPVKLQGDLVRYQADLFVVDTTGVAGLGILFEDYPGSGSMSVSGDASEGGTCFGDSGGPNLVGDTIVAVTSFGLNSNCAGIGGAYRIDKQGDLDFINNPTSGQTEFEN